MSPYINTITKLLQLKYSHWF